MTATPSVAVNPLKAKLAAGQAIMGIWSLIPSPILAEVIGVTGMDFQILDMEHGVYDVQSLDNSIRACESVGCSPLVRVPGVQQFSIQTALDLGSHGVVVPQIADYQEAVQYTKYAPEGMRGFNPFTRGSGYDPQNSHNSKLRNDYGLSTIIIENVQAFQEIEQILSIPHLDVVYLGVYDMSVALGCPGEVNHPLIQDFVEKATQKALSAGKVVGVMVKSSEEIERALALGSRFLVYSVDTAIIRGAMKGIVDSLKRLQ
jgi:2-keto-3-deoxy-L-rhamnonate aldolase RhmA